MSSEKYFIKVFNSHIRGASATVVIDGRYFVVDLNGRVEYFSIDSTRISLGGAANRLLYFHPEENRDFVFYSSNLGILNDSGLIAVLGREKSFIKLRRRVKSSKLRPYTISLSLLILAIVVIFSILPLKRLIIKSIPFSAEVKLGEAVFQSLSFELSIIEDSDILKEFELLISPLLVANSNSVYDFKFYISDDSDPNAFALPGGIVIVNSGLILHAGDSSEVCGVIAHEISHVNARHSLNQIVNQVGIGLALKLLLGDLGDLTESIGHSGSFLASRHFSRRNEREADRLAVELMVRAGINPWGFYNFFEGLVELLNDGILAVDEAFTFLSTHPNHRQRLEYISREIDKIGVEDSDYQEHYDLDNLKYILKKRL
ncbi:MAG: M48 family metalloprotease [Spirochaetales bacterium]|nr:M48 family metalloprotease [Spirochaetales bacterium]